MNNVLMEARFEGDIAKMKEIALDFVKSNDVIKKIARKVEQGGKSNLQTLFYKVSFVHPEVKSFYDEANTTRGDGAAKTYDSILSAYAGRNTIDLVDKTRAGIFALAGNAGRMGSGETEGTSIIATKQFINDMDRMASTINKSEKMNTESQIKSFLSNNGAKASIVSKVNEFNGAIDYDSLFGLKRSVVGEDKWEDLQLVEKWFYTLLDKMVEPAFFDATSLGESVFTYVKKLREVVSDPDVTKMLNDLNLKLTNPNVNGMTDEFNGQLRADSDIFQLGAMLALSKSVKLSGGSDEPLWTYVTSMLDGMGDDEGLRKFGEFMEAPFGFTEKVDTHTAGSPVVRVAVPMKTGVNEWTSDAIHNIISTNANSGNNSVAEELNRKYKARSGKASTAVNKILSLIPPSTAGKRKPLAILLGLIAEDYNPNTPEENLENALVTDPANASDDIGIRKDNAGDAAKAWRMKSTSPIGAADTFLSKMNRITNEDSKSGDSAPVTVTVLDPETDDVLNANILPKISIPLFAMKVTPPASENKALGRIYQMSTPMLTYAIIACANSGIAPLDWFTSTTTRDDDDVETIDVHVNNSDDINCDEVTRVIEGYFSHVASNASPANAVMLRNKWIDIINNAETMLDIIREVTSYIRTRVDDKYLDALPEVMTDTFNHVKRNIFNIKEGRYNVPITHDLEVHDALPISPINQESRGRLRLTGGVEGTVTSDGKRILDKTQGRVVSVYANNGENVYRVHFAKESGLSSAEITESNLDEWMPAGLAIMPDSDSKQYQYAAWVGVNFISEWSDEGYANTLRRPDEMIDVSNSLYTNSTSGSSRTSDTTESMKNFADIMGTISAPAIDAVLHAGEALNMSTDTEFSSVKRLLKFAQSKDLAKVNSLQDSLKCSNIAQKNPNEAASDIMNAIMDTFFATKLSKNNQFYSDVSSLAAIRTLLSACKSDDIKQNANLAFQTTLSGVSSLLDVIDAPFTVSRNNAGDIQIVNSGVEYSTKEYFEAHDLGVNFDRVVNALQENYRQLDAAASGNGDKVSAYNGAIKTLTALEKLYSMAVSEDFSANERLDHSGRLSVDGSISRLRDVAVSEKATDALAKRIELIMPIIKKSPEVMNKSFYDVLAAADYAAKVPEEISKFRDSINDYNAHSAYAEKSRLTSGDTYQDMDVDDLVQPDINGEYDSHLGDMLTNSIDEDALADFDINDDTVSYEDVTYSTMLGLIKCGPGMLSSAGSFDISAGISPTELSMVAASLDSAHESISNMSDEGVYDINTAVEHHYSRTYYILERSLDAFYKFMASSKPIESRNILKEANEIKTLFSSEVAACQGMSVKNMLDEMALAFERLLSEVGTQNNTNESNVDDRNPEYVNLENARAISTGIANIVLKIESYARTNHISAKPNGLERYGDENTFAADRLAAVSARNGTKLTDSKATSRLKAEHDEEIRKKFGDSTYASLGGNERFAKTLSSIYNYLGMGDTLGYKGALIPFNDIITKSAGKFENSFRTLYSGEAKTDLGAVLNYAIVKDEVSKTDADGNFTGYTTLAHMLSQLTDNRPGDESAGIVYVPKFLIRGLEFEDPADKKTPLDMTSSTWVTFDQNGSAIVSDYSQYAHFNEGVHQFDGLSSIGNAIGVQLDDSDSVEAVASKIRKSIIARKLNNSNALSTLEARDKNYTDKIFDDTIKQFRETMLNAASDCTKGAGLNFVPLSVLYACIDDSTLNAAMSQVFERASNVVRGQANKTATLNILRGVFGDKYGELPKSSELIEDNADEIKYDLGNVLQLWRKYPDLNQSTKMKRAITAKYRTDANDADTEVTGSSLADIFGSRDAAKSFVELFLAQIPIDRLSEMDTSELTEIAGAFVDNIIARRSTDNPGEPLMKMVNILSAIGTNNGMGKEDAISEISSILGAGTDSVASELVEEYMEKLSGAKSHSRGAIYNLAERTVRDAVHRDGELRELYLDKYANQTLRDIEARRIMDGTEPIIDKETINGSEGAARLYNKIEMALSGDVPEDEAKDILNSITEFHIHDAHGEMALGQFNEYYDYVKRALSALMHSTFEGLIGLRDGDTEKQRLNRCSPEGSLVTEGAGPHRKADIMQYNQLLETLGKATKTNPYGFNALRTRLNEFVEKHCQWSESLTGDALTSAIQSSRPRNKEIPVEFTEIRKLMAKVFSRTRGMYQDGAISVVAAASDERGISSMGGITAVSNFNQYFDSLKSALTALMNSTRDGIVASLALQHSTEDENSDANRAIKNKRDANRCSPNGVLDIEGAGARRASAIENLDAARDELKDVLSRATTRKSNALDDAIKEFAEKHCKWSPDMSEQELNAAGAACDIQNADAAADFASIRAELANLVFYTTDGIYNGDALSVSGAASKGMGITTGNAGTNIIKRILHAMVKAKDSPIREADSDILPDGYDYLVNGNPMNEGDCIAILSDALQKYMDAMKIDSIPDDSELFNNAFFHCVRMCSSLKRDSLLSTDNILTILFNTMKNRKTISLSSEAGYVTVKQRIKSGYSNRWYTFDVPMDMIRDIANDKISRMDLSESANDWIAWSQELEKFTNRGNAANNDNIKNPDLKNKLDELYREVVNVGLNNKLKSSVENLTPAEKSSLMNNEQVTTADGIRIKTSRNGGHQDASLRYLDYEP